MKDIDPRGSVNVHKGSSLVMRKVGIALLAVFLVLTLSQGLAGAASESGTPSYSASLAKAKEKLPDKLQVKFLDGASIHAKADETSKIVDKDVTCGTLLAYQGKQDGQWFLVKHGKKEGWVNGWLTTFDIAPVYCTETYAEAYPPAPVAQTAVDVTNGSVTDNSVSTDTPDSAYTDTTQPAVDQPVADGGGYADTIAAAAVTYGASYDELMAIWGCETGYVYDFDEMSWAGAYGPFQFLEETYYRMASESGYGGDWQNATDQAYVAAWAFSHGHGSEWDCYYIVG